MEVRQTSEKPTSIAVCDDIDPYKPLIDERLRSCCDKHSVLLKYATSANSVPPMKPLSFHTEHVLQKKRTAHEDGRVGCSEDVRNGCDVGATIGALQTQKYIAYPPENCSCAGATNSVLPRNARRTAQERQRTPQASVAYLSGKNSVPSRKK